MRCLSSAAPATAVLVLTAACSMHEPVTGIEPIRNATGMADGQVTARYVRVPRPERFSLCHGHTCHVIAEVNLPQAEWNVIRGIFVSPAHDPAAERDQIARAVAALETIVGELAGTGSDRGLNFPGLGLPAQMDCVDEATNTSAYLLMLQNDGLLRWHRAGPRVSRGILQLKAPHFTATVVEQRTGTAFAVDSWFEDNGHPPHIVPLDDWLRGWSPNVAGQMAGDP
jgi:hypothetical protein